MRIDAKPLFEKACKTIERLPDFQTLNKEDQEKFLAELNEAENIFNILLNDTVKNPDPKKRAMMLFNLSIIHREKNHTALAIFLLHEAINEREKLGEAFMEADNNLGLLYKKERALDKAKHHFEQALKISEKYKDVIEPQDRAIYITNLASLSIGNGEPEKALEQFNEAIKLDPYCPHANWNRALALLENGDYENGFFAYDSHDRQKKISMRNYT